MLNANEIWCLLISHGKLERDRGTEKLQEICKSFDTNDLQCFSISDKSCSASLNCKNEEILADIFQKLVQYPISIKETAWETKIGVLIGCQV